jgi:hypothetical protein
MSGTSVDVDLLVEIQCCDSADGLGVFGAVQSALFFDVCVCNTVTAVCAQRMISQSK